MCNELNRETERRVLLVPPTARDGEVTRGLLAKEGLACVICQGLHQLVREIEAGAGVVLLTEDALAAPGIDALLTALANQPPWSDLSVVLLMRSGELSPKATQVLGALNNVTLLDRPAPTRSV